MRVAQVAPLAESVPPLRYGGTERVCSWLTEELVALGHEVVLFASGDSVTSATLVPCSPAGLRGSGVQDHAVHLLLMLDHVRQRAAEFDVIHFHVDLYQFPLFRDIAAKCLTTLHGRLDLPDMHRVYRTFRSMPLVSISEAQRHPIGDANWAGTIQHGMPTTLIPFSSRGGNYLAFLGRISPEKRPDRAIDIALGAGVPLKIAAKVDDVDRAYFDREIRPRLDHPLIEFIGEIGDAQKERFLGDALALIFPIDWPEPFGLVMIEAMAAGTPVIAWRIGSVPEVVDAGVTGFVVQSIEESISAVHRVGCMNRLAVRRRFEQRFSAERMAQDYVDLYRELLAARAVVTERSMRLAPRFEGPALRPLHGGAAEIGAVAGASSD